MNGRRMAMSRFFKWATVYRQKTLPGRRAKMTLAMGAVGVLVGVFGAAAPASASSNAALIQDDQTGLCLQATPIVGNQYHVTTEWCDGFAHQRWDLLSGGRFQNEYTGYCLDSNDHGDGHGSVYDIPCNGGNYQAWYFISGSRIIDVATNLCLDSNDYHDVYTHWCNGGRYQNWFALRLP
jgi:hypothetical protein